jgi:hypothetical protein
MGDMIVPNRVEEMAMRIEELERRNADLERHNKELRETVAALLAPARAPVETMGGRIG